MKLLPILILGLTMSACSMFGSSVSWKEEVLLHDGTRMVVLRSQTRSGAGEIGQGPPITEHSVTFTPVGSNQSVLWKSESSANIRHANLDLLALDVVNGTPYIVTSPSGCLVYEKWNRPNPPYIFFKYINQHWRQISLQEFPAEIKQPNLVINIYRMEDIRSEEKKSGFVSAVGVKEINGSLRQEEYQTILRQPIVRTGKSASVVDCSSFSADLKAPYPILPRDVTEPKKQPP